MKIVDNITLDNMMGLLEECIVNGDRNPETLYAWFVENRNLMTSILRDVED